MTCPVECLHRLPDRADLRCCECGAWFDLEITGVGSASFDFRVDAEHKPAGQYWPSIVSERRNHLALTGARES